MDKIDISINARDTTKEIFQHSKRYPKESYRIKRQRHQQGKYLNKNKIYLQVRETEKKKEKQESCLLKSKRDISTNENYCNNRDISIHTSILRNPAPNNIYIYIYKSFCLFMCVCERTHRDILINDNYIKVI